VKDVQPTVYVGNTIVSNSDAPPLCADVTAGFVSQLGAGNSLFGQVELITVKLKSAEDQNFVLNLTKIPGFTNLKYVYFLCEYNCAAADLEKLFLPKTGITVLFKISIGS
jgi:hypothetical protein